MANSEKREVAVVTSKGQLVIPATLRRRFGIKQGTSIVFLEENGRIILQPVTTEFLHQLRGAAKRAEEEADQKK